MEENTQQSNSFMPMILAAIAILAVAGGAYYFTQMKPQTVIEETPVTTADETSLAGSGNNELDTATDSGEMMKVDENAKIFEVSASNFDFSVTEMKVKKGETVTVVFTNDEGTHDWVLDEFDAKTEMLNAGESAEITFVADEAGEFEYYCSVGQHRSMGMVGKLIVE